MRAMAGAPPGTRIARFGDVEANLDTGEIVRDGQRLVLPDQPLRILARLIDHPGAAVSRDELQRELWADDTFVDFEHGLNSAIKRLRDALGDSADAPRYIETVPRRGYRFVGELESEPDAEKPPATSGVSARSSWWLSVGVVVVLAATALGWRTWSGRTSSVSSPVAWAENRILVAAVESGADTGSLSPVGKMNADHLIAAISRVETADVLPTAVPSSSMEGAIASAARSGAALVVEVVSHTLASDQFFEARVHDARTQQVLYFSPRFKASVHQPGTGFDPLAQAVAGAIAVQLDPGFGGLQVTSEPPLLEAYLEYWAGSDLLERDYPRAIARFQRAAQISPGYLLPRLLLVMAYDNQGDRENVSAEMAQIAANAHRLTTAERLLVEYMRESLARRSALALRALLDAEKLAPRSYIVNFCIQQEALRLHRPSVAIAAFDRLPSNDRLRRYNGWRLGGLARALHLVGDYTREAAESRRAQEYEPGNVFYALDEVRARAGLGDVSGITRVIDNMLAMPVTAASPTMVIVRAVRELRAHGHKQASVQIANRGIDWLQSGQARTADGVQRDALARLLYLADREREAEPLFARLSAERPDSVEYLGYLGAIAARRLDRRRANELAERLQDWDGPETFGAQTYWRAAIATLLGERNLAVALLRDAFGQGYDRGLRIHASPELEALRDFPPFVALVAPQN